MQQTADTPMIIRTTAEHHGLDERLVERAWNAAADSFGAQGADDEISNASRARIKTLGGAE